MKDAGELEQENAALRDRLSRLSQASLRINESLDFDTVLQEVLDSARALTGARYGVITLLDESGRIQDFLYSGLTPEESGSSPNFPTGCCSSSGSAASVNRCGCGISTATPGSWACPSSARRWR